MPNRGRSNQREGADVRRRNCFRRLPMFRTFAGNAGVPRKPEGFGERNANDGCAQSLIRRFARLVPRDATSAWETSALSETKCPNITVQLCLSCKSGQRAEGAQEQTLKCVFRNRNKQKKMRRLNFFFFLCTRSYETTVRLQKTGYCGVYFDCIETAALPL